MDSGKQQLIRAIATSNNDNDNPMTAQDHAGVVATLRSMDQYARYTLTDPSTDSKTRERCRNESRMCAEWASRMSYCHPTTNGQEEQIIMNSNDENNISDGVVFMMNRCPLACQMCEELESFHSCTGRRHPNSQPSFQSGELNSFFERKRAGDEWTEYEPIFVSYPNAEKKENKDDPYVVLLQNFLSEEEANHLQSLGSEIGWERASSVSLEPHDTATCHHSDQCNKDTIYQQIMLRISSLTNSSISHLTPMEMVEYQSSKPQREKQQRLNNLPYNSEVSSFWMPAGSRVLSIFCFLSDGSAEKEGGSGGGGIGFPYLDWLSIRPKKGMAVVWPNVRNRNLLESDPLTSVEYFPLHGEEGKGLLFGAKVNVMLYNWTDADTRGCG